jgi:hypothetical protein
MLINFLAAMLLPFAGPYRVLAFRRGGSFRTISEGVLTWMVIGYPLSIATFSPQAGAGMAWLWVVLIVGGWVQMFATWCTATLDPSSSHAWAAKGEFAYTLGATILIHVLCGEGSSMFFAIGYVCSEGELGLRRWMPEDTRRVLAAGHAASAWTIRAVPAVGGAALGVICPLGRGVWGFVRSAWSARRAAQAQAPQIARAGFWNRVGSYLVGHIIFSILTGAFGLWGIIKYFSYVLAAILAMMGWDLTPPDSVREEARGVISRFKEKVKDEKEEAHERINDKISRFKSR